ncbi:MAG: hypothetical protein ACREO8_09310 [Luteimonas sp.]
MRRLNTGMSRVLILGLTAFAALIVVLALSLGPQFRSRPLGSTGAPTPAPAAANSGGSVAPALPPPQASTLPESAFYGLKTQWWTPTPAESDTVTPLQRDASCADNGFLGSAASMEELLATRAAIRTPADRERVFYNKDRRFFQRNGRYHSVTADWDIEQPPRYRINWFSSANANFEGDLRAEPLPVGTTETLDAIQARELLDATASAETGSDSQAGGRFLAVSVAPSPSTPGVEVGFMNNRAFAVGFDGGTCRLLASGSAAYCSCTDPSTTKGDSHAH